MNEFISNPMFCREHEALLNNSEIKKLGEMVIKKLNNKDDFIVPCTHQLSADLEVLKTELYDPTKTIENITTLADMMDLIYVLTYVVTGLNTFNPTDAKGYLNTMSEKLKEQSGEYIKGFWLRGFYAEMDDEKDGEKE